MYLFDCSQTDVLLLTFHVPSLKLALNHSYILKNILNIFHRTDTFIFQTPRLLMNLTEHLPSEISEQILCFSNFVFLGFFLSTRNNHQIYIFKWLILSKQAEIS